DYVNQVLIGIRQPPNTLAAGFLNVALGQCAGVEVTNQNRSFRSLRTASDTDASRLRIGRNVGSALVVGNVTAPFVDNLRSTDDNDPSEGNGRNSATGSPRSVTTRVRPSRTR